MYRVLFFTVVFLLFIFASTVSAQTNIPAFPGAEGYGATTPGGRGGAVFLVTNTNDSGSGSLRACAEASGPRTCVFRTGGTIALNSRIKISNPYLTIAGQTAPGDGVTVRSALSNAGHTIEIKTHDVIIRYLRVRAGPEDQRNSDSRDGIAILEGGNNIILDHTSISWGTDENISMGQGASNVTVQWSIISEGLNCSTDPERTCTKPYDNGHSKGFLIGSGGASNVSIHHTLFAHNYDRSPLIKLSSGYSDLVNNVIYNSYTPPIRLQDDNAAQESNVVGNYIVNGPQSRDIPDIELRGNIKAFIQDHIGPNPVASTASSRFNTPSVTTISAQQAYAKVLEGAGATFPRRDAVDKRIVAEVEDRSGDIIDAPSEALAVDHSFVWLTPESYTKFGITDPLDNQGWPVLVAGTAPPDTDNDGIPDTWETQLGFNIQQNDANGDKDGDGYTNLEEYLNAIVSGTAPPITPRVTTPSVTLVSSLPFCDLTGDLDCSGVVNAADLTIFLTAFGTNNASADLDDSGRVNAVDLTLLLQSFGQTN